MSLLLCFFFLMIRRPPRSTRSDTLCPYRRSSELAERPGCATRGVPVSAPARPLGGGLVRTSDDAGAAIAGHTRAHPDTASQSPHFGAGSQAVGGSEIGRAHV